MREVAVQPQRVPPFRLPDTIKPRHYDIEIEPDLINKTMNGKVNMHLDIVKPTNVISFHALRMKITSIVVKPSSSLQEIMRPVVQYAPQHQAAFVKLENQFPAGSSLILSVEYVGEMTRPGSMGGLYPSPFQMPDGQVNLGFETMSEPTMARAVFPCMDEPDLKATFTVSLIVDPELTCLSNMDAVSDKPTVSITGESKKHVTFETTPKMSTYLVVMVGGYFNKIETNDFHVPIRVWAAVDKNIDTCYYALEMAVKAMNTHEKNYGLKYPLPKLDMVAVPGHSGGMEHWGCVTYEERGLVLGDNPSINDKKRSASLITHELGHQWFGNIVTMKWWDSVWLNEAFSDWATHLALSQMFPDFDEWADFVSNDPSPAGLNGYQNALSLDSNIGSHAIEDPNVPPGGAFDSIAYLKGCSIIRMMAEDLGVDVFLKGISHYLKSHAYGNATTEDLWKALSEISGKDVQKTMAVWIHTVGYPLLTVNELRPTRNIVISQARFLQNGDESTQKVAYPVTVHIRGPNGVKKHLMEDHEIAIPANLFEYKVNADLAGFYRVSYPLSRIHKLGVQFTTNFLSAKDKVGIISDLSAVVASGAPDRRARVSDFLDFILSVSKTETDLFVWREILAQLERVRLAFLFEGKYILDTLTSVRFTLLKGLMKTALEGFKPDDPDQQTYLKELVLSQLKDHPLAQQQAKKAWKQLLSGDKDAINPNIRRIVFETVLQFDNTDKTWNTLKSIAFELAYIRPDDPVTYLDALFALGSAQNPALIKRTLALITPGSEPELSSVKIGGGTRVLSDTTGRKPAMSRNNRFSVLKSLALHPGGAKASWNWLQENWSALNEEGKNGSINSHEFVRYSLAGLATYKHLLEVKDFFADKTDQSFELLLTQALDIIRARARFVEVDREDLETWSRNRSFV